MIEKVIRIKNLNDKSLISDDLKYWLSKTPEERVATVDYLRKQLIEEKNMSQLITSHTSVIMGKPVVSGTRSN